MLTTKTAVTKARKSTNCRKPSFKTFTKPRASDLLIVSQNAFSGLVRGVEKSTIERQVQTGILGVLADITERARRGQLAANNETPRDRSRCAESEAHARNSSGNQLFRVQGSDTCRALRMLAGPRISRFHCCFDLQPRSANES